MLETQSITISVADRTIRLQLPADPEQMLDDAVRGEASGDRHTDPYWGLLWDAAPATARCILTTAWPTKPRALELGCGVGLAGIAGLMAGLDVTFSDLVPSAVQMAQENAAANGFPEAPGLVLDWQQPPSLTFDLLLGSDILYDAANHLPLLNTLDRMLAPSGNVWIGDAGRANTPLFIRRAQQAGWAVQIRDDHNCPLAESRHIRFQLLVMSRGDVSVS